MVVDRHGCMTRFGIVGAECVMVLEWEDALENAMMCKRVIVKGYVGLDDCYVGAFIRYAGVACYVL
jgi:hypothetical protein